MVISSLSTNKRTDAFWLWPIVNIKDNCIKWHNNRLCLVRVVNHKWCAAGIKASITFIWNQCLQKHALIRNLQCMSLSCIDEIYQNSIFLYMVENLFFNTNWAYIPQTISMHPSHRKNISAYTSVYNYLM